MNIPILKLFYKLLTDQLGLPIEPLWEYAILLIVGEIVHEIAWNASPGGRFGSIIYWGTKLIVYIVTWAILYSIIAAVKFIVAHWIWFAVVLIVITIAIITYCKSQKI